MWVTLLATQLQNQDPTNPVDTNQFTSQILSLSTLEQQALTNDTLSSLLDAVQSLEADSAFSYIGSTITAEGDTAPLTDGSANWLYDLDDTASSVTLTVKDLDGNTVYTASGDTASGLHAFTWDGTTSGGGTAEDGAYVLSVSATGDDGSSVDSTLYVKGKVTGSGTADGATVLYLDDIEVAKSDVISVNAN